MAHHAPLHVDYGRGFPEMEDVALHFERLFGARSVYRVRYQDLLEQMRARVSPHFNLPYLTEDLKEILALADHLRDGADHIVFFGTGGSSLCGQTFAQLSTFIPKTDDVSPVKIHFYDNLDPDRFSRLLDQFDLSTTRFVIISKSGGTAETLLQARLILQHFSHRSLSKLIATHVVGLSEPKRPQVHNPLRTLLSYYGAKVFAHDPQLGGRFTAFSIVGLLPAALCGLDISALRRGARWMIDTTLDHPFGEQNTSVSILNGALWHLDQLERGRDISVFMGYGECFERLGAWFQQLWAESLGKEGSGFVPIKALGPVDQHSQMQLFLDGPDQFALSLASVDTLRAELDPRLKLMSEQHSGLGITVFDDLHLTQFTQAQVMGALSAIAARMRPVRHIRLRAIEEESIGALMMMMMIETVLCGLFMGVNPYDQPAVEEVKRAALQHLEKQRGA